MQAEKNIDQSLGSLLHAARALKKESILAVSKQIRIQPKFLDALEKNEYTVFPSPAFAIGFLRKYALYLNLDGNQMCDLLRQEFKGLNEPHLHFPKTTPEKMFPSKRITYASAIVLLLLCISFSFDFKNTSPDLQETEVVSIQPIVEQKKEEYHETQHQTVHIKLKALGKCWIEVRNQEKRTSFDKMLEIGEELEISPSLGEKLTIGNAAGIEIIINGKTSGPLGKEGEVISNIPLDSDHLFSHYVQTPVRR